MTTPSQFIGQVISHYRIIEKLAVAGWAWFTRPDVYRFVAFNFVAFNAPATEAEQQT